MCVEAADCPSCLVCRCWLHPKFSAGISRFCLTPNAENWTRKINSLTALILNIMACRDSQRNNSNTRQQVVFSSSQLIFQEKSLAAAKMGKVPISLFLVKVKQQLSISSVVRLPVVLFLLLRG